MAASTAVRNTATGFTSPLQWTTTAGGSAIEWYTPMLYANTLSGVVKGNIRAAESNTAANGTVRLEVAVCNSDGTNVTVYGSACATAEMATSEGVLSIEVAGPDVALADSQRIRFRLYLDDFEAALASSYTATVYYSGATAEASGDTYVVLSTSLTEYAPAIFGATATASATLVSQFALTPNWYFLSTTTDGWGVLQVGGSAPSDATVSTGWMMYGVSTAQYSRMAFGSVRATDTFSGTAQPSSGPDNTLKDAWRTTSAISGTIAAGSWKMHLPCIAPLEGAEGANLRLRLRIWKSANADGSSPTEITSGTQVGSTITDLQSTSPQISSFAFTLSEITLSSDYLFVQVAAETV